jgi:hypothetical protein
MTFVNLTPHEIVVRETDDTERKFAPSGQVARVSVTSEKVAEPEGIPVLRQVFGQVQGLPEAVEGTLYITSTLVAQVARRADVVSPDTGPKAIREGGQVVAVRGFQSFA